MLKRLLMLALLICLAGTFAPGQNAAKTRAAEAQAKKTAENAASAESETKKSAENAATAESETKRKAEADAQRTKSPDAYRLDFSVNELEEGKKVNTRQYSMNSRSGDWNEIKIGTRVPVESKTGQDLNFQYLDVGTNIRARLLDPTDMNSMGTDVALSASADLSNFAMPDQQGQRVQPVIRQLRIQASTIVSLGKPMVVGVVDDPNSKRQFQLEVMVTKLR